MGLGKFRIYLEMIKFEHSVFALPFAYLGAFLSQARGPGLRYDLLDNTRDGRSKKFCHGIEPVDRHRN